MSPRFSWFRRKKSNPSAAAAQPQLQPPPITFSQFASSQQQLQPPPQQQQQQQQRPHSAYITPSTALLHASLPVAQAAPRPVSSYGGSGSLGRPVSRGAGGGEYSLDGGSFVARNEAAMGASGGPVGTNTDSGGKAPVVVEPKYTQALYESPTQRQDAVFPTPHYPPPDERSGSGGEYFPGGLNLATGRSMSGPAGLKVIDSDTRSIYPPPPPDYCISTWGEALLRCEQELGSEDFERVSQFANEQDFFESLRMIHLQEDGAQESMGRLALLSKMEPCLNHLKSFTTLLAIGQGGIQTAVLWGCFNLMIELALNYEDTLKEITEMLKELDHQLGLFHLYQTHAILQNDASTREEIINVLVEVVMFAVLIIRFFRRTPIRQMMESLVNIRGRFEVIAASIRTKTQNVKERIAALQLTSEAMAISNRSPNPNSYTLANHSQHPLTSAATANSFTDDAKLPCIHMPWPENTQFYKRKAVFDAIINDLGPDTLSSQNASARRQRSLAIYGTAGIGKTQLALAFGYHWHHYYLEKQREAGTGEGSMSAVLWVNGEDQLSFAESFTSIALALELPGASPSASSASENEILVRKWLQTTNARWLLIFDNIEDIELLGKNWPKSSPGSILVTCRSMTIAGPPIAKSMEIPAFDVQEGSDFLITLVTGEDSTRNTTSTSSTNCNTTLQSESELRNAQALAEKLGGLPLAMFMMATQIRNRRQTFEQFIPFHAKNSRKLSKRQGPRNLYYKADLMTAWEIPFKSLSENAATLMGVLSFWGADSIPHEVFLTSQEGLVGCEDIEFLLDEWALGEAIQELLDSTLMKRDANTSMYSFHRLIQDQYHYHMTRDVALKNFKLATSLMNAAFPKQIDGRSLRKYSDQCQKLIQHVTALCQSYEELYREKEIDYEFEDFTMLLSNAAWHLLEMNYFDIVLQLLDTGLRNCHNLPTIGHSNILNVGGLIHLERGDFPRGLSMQLQAESIRKSLLPPTHPEIANMYNNIGLSVLSLGEVDKAGELFEKAIEIDMLQKKEDRDQILHIRHLNLADVDLLKGRWKECKRNIELGRVYAILTFGTDTHLVAQADRQLGNCLAAEGKYAEAQERYEIARRLFMKENPKQKANSTVCLALGRVLMAQGKHDEAVTTLREALELCQVNETSKGNDGDMARVMRALAEALRLQAGNDEGVFNGEAGVLREQAEAVRKVLLGEKYVAENDGQRDWDALVCCLYR